MNVEEAKILFNTHISEYIYPSMKNETMLIMVSKEKVIHIYSADDDYMFAPMGVRKVYVLEKNRDGKELDAITSIRKYDAVDIARVINREGFMISMVNSSRSVIEKMISKNILSHRNTIDPSQDTILEKMGKAHHNYCFYTHEIIKESEAIKSRET
jgi:hypothetical protein